MLSRRENTQIRSMHTNYILTLESKCIRDKQLHYLLTIKATYSDA